MFTALLAAALTTLPVPDAPAPLRARVTDPAVIRTAVKAALATDAPPSDTGRILSGDAHAGLGEAFD